MSELRWNWVYYPYLDAPNKQEKSALKAGYIKVVIKSEADKVIAELKDKLDLYKRGWEENDKINANLYAQLLHQKRKRCLAMAYVEWLKQLIIGNHPESILFRRAFKRHRKWRELAEKFKEAK